MHIRPTRKNLPTDPVPTEAGHQETEGNRKYARKLLRDRLLRPYRIRILGIPRGTYLGIPRGDNHLSRREYTEDAPAAERRVQRVAAAEQNGANGGGFPSEKTRPFPPTKFLIWGDKGWPP